MFRLGSPLIRRAAPTKRWLKVAVDSTPSVLPYRVLSDLPQDTLRGLQQLTELRHQILSPHIAPELAHLLPQAAYLATDLAQQVYTTESNAIEGSEYDLHSTVAAVKHRDYGSGTTAEYYDAVGHDQAIGLLEQVCREDEPLTFEYPKQLHALLLPDDSQRSRSVFPGEYRTYPNYSLTKDGPHLYPHPDTIEEAMSTFNKKMLEFFNNVPDNSYRHPLVTGTLLHYSFVALHPFGDGNGRVARLLMNTILLRHGYQPAVIQAKSKQEYFETLAAVDENKDVLPLVQLCLREAIKFHEFVATLQADCVKALANQKPPVSME